MSDSRQRLVDELAVAAASVADLERQHARVVAASEWSNADDEHDPEGSTIAFEREQLSAVLEHSRRRRGELAAALARLDDGTYGTCERCGGAIGVARLEARPDASTCIDCAV
jgi:DnaK suppressor protein